MMMPAEIDRYLFRVLLKGALIVLLPLTALEALIGFADEARRLDEGQTLGQLVWLSVHQLPVTAHHFLPIAVFVGGLLGLGSLLAQGEMTAAFALGYSRCRLGLSIMTAGLFFAFLTAVLGELVVPIQEKTLSALSSSQAPRTWRSSAPFSEKWMRVGRQFIYAERMDGQGVYHEISVYRSDEDGRIVETVRARRMRNENGKYLASGVSRAQIGGDRLVFSEASELELASFPAAGDAAMGSDRPPQWMSARQLWHYVQFLQKSGLRDEIHRMEMWLHLTHPLTVPALLFLLLPFVFIGHGRKGQGLFLGVIVGIVYSILVRSFSGVALTYGWPLWTGAFLPLLIVAATALLMLLLMRFGFLRLHNQPRA